jgi:hypothetical protein
MISRASFTVSRWIWVNQMRIMYAVSAVFLVCGLMGPRYGSFLALTALLIGKAGVALASPLWLIVMLLKKRDPGFRLENMVSEPAAWNVRSSPAQMGAAMLFVSVALMLASIGARLGTLGVYFDWRAT